MNDLMEKTARRSRGFAVYTLLLSGCISLEAGKPPPEGAEGGGILAGSAAGRLGDDVIYSIAISKNGDWLAGGVRNGVVAEDAPTSGGALLVGQVPEVDVDRSDHFIPGTDNKLIVIDAIAFDKSLNYIMVGSFDGMMTLKGAMDTTATLVSTGMLDWFVAKFTVGGQLLAARSFGGSLDDRPHAIALMSGALVIAGEFRGTVDFGLAGPLSAEGADAIAVVLNADSTLSTRETQVITGPGDQVATGVALGPAGRVIVGHHEGFQANGEAFPSEGSRDIFVLVGDPPEVKAISFGGKGDQIPSGVAVAPDGRIAITGVFKGETDLDGVVHTTSGDVRNLFLAIQKPNGEPLASQVPASAGDVLRTSATFDALGNIVMSCGFSGKITFDGLPPLDAPSSYDACAVKFDGGDYHALWARQFGDTAAFQAGFAIAPSDEAIYLGGAFAGALPMPTETLEAFDGKDAFTLELKP